VRLAEAIVFPPTPFVGGHGSTTINTESIVFPPTKNARHRPPYEKGAGVGVLKN
jgi:hypothetical protein